MHHKKIVFLASDCESSRWVYNALIKKFPPEAAIIETPVSKKVLFKGRLKRIGFIKVCGQVLFSLLLVPFLRKKAVQRKAALVKQYDLSDNGFNNSNTHYVSSVNDAATIQLLQQLQPDIVVVNGTRIISRKVLQCTSAIFINMHVGITPLYRGSHGGYWALYNNDIDNFGTTIHLVDTGVDTGKILAQAFATPHKEDNFTTYPVLQTAIGIPLLMNVLKAVNENTIEGYSKTEKGNLYYQPTIWQYLMNQNRVKKTQLQN
jgi:folate-dependent phosphoribosylglycinamide formyltransferase PurN